MTRQTTPRSFEQWSPWAVVLSVVLAYGWYVVTVMSGEASGTGAEVAYRQPMAVMVVVMVVLLAATHAVLAATSPRQVGRRREDDMRHARQGRSAAAFVLAGGAVATVAMAMAHADPAWIANVALAGLVVSEVTAQAVRIVQDRRASGASGTVREDGTAPASPPASGRSA